MTGQSQLRKKVYAVARELGMTRRDRLEFAGLVMAKPIPSWDSLDEDEIGRIADALTGYIAGRELLIYHKEGA